MSLWKEKRIDKEKTKSLPKPSSVPYLPLGNYDITSEATDIIPYEIAEKYKIVPVGKTGNIISIVMENPYDEEAVNTVENFTGCVVRRFIGTHAEIEDAIASFWPHGSKTPKAPQPQGPQQKEANIQEQKPNLAQDALQPPEPPELADLQWDGKAERRSAYRFKCALDAYFPNKASYIMGKTLDISYTGIAIISKSPISVGTYLNVRIDIPDKGLILPIALLVLVVRSPRIDGENFCIGGKIIKVDVDKIKKLVKYFSAANEALGPYKGLDKRKYARYKADLDLWLPVNTSYIKASLQDISDCGFSFKSRKSLPVGSYLSVEIAPVRDLSKYPIIWLAEVARATTTPDGNFDIGMKWASFYKDGSAMDTIIKYAGKHPSQ